MGALRKILTTGVGAALITEENLRALLGDGKITRQAKDYLVRQASKGRQELTKMLVGEFKRFLDHVDLQSEIQKAVTGMKIDIHATVTLSPQGKPGDPKKFTVRRLKVQRV